MYLVYRIYAHIHTLCIYYKHEINISKKQCSHLIVNNKQIVLIAMLGFFTEGDFVC